MAGATVAALRHRPRQALLLLLLSALVGASAVLGPLYARAVEQSVLRNVVADADITDRVLVVEASGADPPAPAELAEVAERAAPPYFAKGTGGARTTVLFAAGDLTYLARLASREGLCDRVVVSAGRCVQGPGEVLVSRRAGEQAGLEVGDQLRLRSQRAAGSGQPVEDLALVVGRYDAIDPSDEYWAGRGQQAPPPPQPGAGDGRRAGDSGSAVITVDDLFTSWATLAESGWPDLQTSVDIPLRAQAADLTLERGIAESTARVDERVSGIGGTAQSELAAVLQRSSSQRDQARSVIPVLAVQLAVLGVVVLAFVCAAATEQRRPELALARLRGQGPRGAAALLFRELGPLIVVGTVLGGPVAWLVAASASAAWLEPGVHLEARLPALLALGAAVLAGLLALAAAAAPTLRQPVTSLLRRVPPRASALQVGLGEGAVAAAAAAGLVTLLAGEGGPVALLAPGLLAVAGGLLLAQLTVPVAASAARRLFRRGRIAGGLAGVQLARRPAQRRLVAIITVACALLVFAVDAWSVSARNRDLRAQLEAGAATVLTVDAGTADQLQAAVDNLDPDGELAAPVVVTRSATEAGPVTLAVDPAGFRRVASWNDTTGRPTAEQVQRLSPPRAPALELPGASEVVLAFDVTYDVTVLPRPRGLQGTPRPPRLAVLVDGAAEVGGYVDIGELQPGRRTMTARVPCPQACTLRAVIVERAFGDSYPLAYQLRVHGIETTAAGRTSRLDLGPATPRAWQLVDSAAPSPGASVVPPGAQQEPLLISDSESFQSLVVQRGDVPVLIPALGTGQLPRAFRSSVDDTRGRVVAPDLSASDRLYRVIRRFPALPGGYERSVLVDLGSLSGGDRLTGVRTTYQVWLSSSARADVERVARELSAAGIEIVRRDGTEQRRALLADEGAALALRLALLAGVAGLLLGAAVLMVGVATSATPRARDLAGLRVVGVPARTVRSAAVTEHVVVAVLGGLAGAGLGLVAAQAALPRVPLFATASASLGADLSPAWWPVVLAAAGSVLLLSTVAVVVGGTLAASAVPDRLRNGR